MANTAKSKVTVELTELDPKKKVVKFASLDDNPAMGSAYISNEAVKQLGGCEDGVKITIEAL